MNTRFLLSLFISVCLPSFAFAEKAPLSVDELQQQADAIVIATIESIRVDSEPSFFESGFGNTDWGIYLALTIEKVEKGIASNHQLESRCFRIRSRRSLTEYLTPSGHHPIPGTGTIVRAYLERAENSWNVVLPNGITSVDDVNEWPGRDLQDAVEVTQLRSRRYTYFLPLETWVLMIFVGIPILLFFTLLARRYRKQRIRMPDSSTESIGRSI